MHYDLLAQHFHSAGETEDANLSVHLQLHLPQSQSIADH
jgi:hypothetical protein